MSTGLDQPHHDGSERYVSSGAPELGDTVAVFLRVPHGAEAGRVHVRTTPDAEPRYTEAVVDRVTPAETWWRADITLENPETRYRFLLHGGGAYRWVTGTGVHHRDVSDAFDFRVVTFPPPPAWLTEAVVYEVFLDRFARAAPVPLVWPSWAVPAGWDDPVLADGRVAVHQLYGGDLAGVEAHLDHIAGLGANTVYLTPFFPAPSSHRYDASTFSHVDPLLGGDEALASLTATAHNRGLRVVGDLTTNHSGSTHEWFELAQADAASPEAGFYFLGDHPGDYVAWLGVPTLPKFDHRSPVLRRRLLAGDASVVARWLRPPFELDGWRIDVANMTGRLGEVDELGEVARTIRATMAAARPGSYLVAEHCYDASADLRGDGWHGTMAYAGFTRPVWSWLAGPATGAALMGSPAGLAHLPGAAVAATMREHLASVPWRSAAASMTLLDSHDTARFRTVANDRRRHVAAAGLLATYPGVPMVFAGDEVGLEGRTSDDGRRPMPWDRTGWDHTLLAAFRELLQLRRASPALQRGGLRWAHVGDDTLVFLRESLNERVLVAASRAAHEPVVLDAGLLGQRGTAPSLYGGVPLTVEGGAVALPAPSEAAVHVWRLEP